MEAPEHQQSDQSVQSRRVFISYLEAAIAQSYKRAHEIGREGRDDDPAHEGRSGGKPSFCVRFVLDGHPILPLPPSAVVCGESLYLYFPCLINIIRSPRLSLRQYRTTRAWNVAIKQRTLPRSRARGRLGGRPSRPIWSKAAGLRSGRSTARRSLRTIFRILVVITFRNALTCAHPVLDRERVCDRKADRAHSLTGVIMAVRSASSYSVVGAVLDDISFFLPCGKYR
jgi:hypothetical protein